MRDFIRETLQKEITRKQFLQTLGGGLLSVIGVRNFIDILSERAALTGDSSRTERMKRNSSHGFGSNKFGI